VKLVAVFNVFEISCSSWLHFFDHNYSKNSEILLKFETVFYVNSKVSFIPVMKAEYSASLLQSSVSHDPSEITLI